MPLHNAFAVKYGTTVIAGLSQLDAQTNPNVEAESTSGSPFPQFALITEQKPRIMFQTKQVAALLGVTGLTGAAIDDTNTLVSYFAKLADTGLPAVGPVHRAYTAVRGLLLPRRLTCQSRGNVQVDAEALLFSTDGAAHPLAIADNLALPTIVRNNIQHTLGPITLGVSGTTTLTNCVQGLTIDFGSGAETLGCGSDLYDAHLQLPRLAPVITITGIDAALFGASGVPPIGRAIKHDGTKLFLRKRAIDGVGFVANNVTEHIKMTINGLAVVTSHTGQGTARAEVSLQITTHWDGTLAPVTIDTASAIA